MNYYQHHIGDYRRDTAHLSLLEHGIYRQLLDTYYLTEQPIPEETEAVCRRLSAKTDEERKAVVSVLNDFFYLDNGWKHRRCEVEIHGYQEKAETARANGKLGGRPKKTQPVISGNQEKTESQANHKPITINHKPISIADRFQEFWEIWPNTERKADKKKCRAKWAAGKFDAIADKIFAHIATQKTTQKWQTGYEPAPMTYLNGERWNDGVAESAPAWAGAK